MSDDPLSFEGKTVYAEGCLSIPGEAEDIERAAEVLVQYTDVEGNTQTLRADGLLSIAIQHECDHLEGIVFVDHLLLGHRHHHLHLRNDRKPQGRGPHARELRGHRGGRPPGPR